MTPRQEQELRAALPDKIRQSVASQLVALALADSDFIRGLDGQPYAVAKEGPSLAQALRGEGSYRKHLAARFYAATGQVANANALSDALLVLDARADEREPQPVYQRVAPTGNGVVLDLGRPDHLVVEITAQGWSCRTLTGSDPLFKRTRQMQPMPEPLPGGGLQKLWSLVNVRPADRAVLAGFMAAAFLPDVAQPFVLLRGEQGTGKTTAGKMLLTLLDPGPGQMTTTPRTEKDFAVAAQGRVVLGVDNLSTITPAFSDMICRAVTGESIVTRALFTDDSQSIISYRLGLILTSIDPGALRGDLAERMLPITLEPFPAGARVEQDLWLQFTAAAPELLGAVLDRVVVGLRNQSGVDTPAAGWPRMAGFGKLLAALDREHGTTSLSSYVQTVSDSELDVVAGDPSPTPCCASPGCRPSGAVQRLSCSRKSLPAATSRPRSAATGAPRRNCRPASPG